MEAALTGIVAFLAIFGGAAIGMAVARRLPKPHLSAETRTAVSVSMAVVGTLAALVLSLLITTANTSFTTRSSAIATLATDIIKLDRVLLRYGPEASGVRAALRSYAVEKKADLEETVETDVLGLDLLKRLEAIEDRIVSLRPADDRQRQIQARATQIINGISDERWILVERTQAEVPTAFLVLLIFWLALLFASFGLFSPHNGTVLAILLLCALAISGGIVFIVDLAQPAQSLVRTSFAPLDTAIAEIDAN